MNAIGLKVESCEVYFYRIYISCPRRPTHGSGRGGHGGDGCGDASVDGCGSAGGGGSGGASGGGDGSQ